MITYILIGLIWTLFLEFLTSRDSHFSESMEWSNRERVVQTFIWPVSVIIFLIEFFRGLWR